jgi:hypothetical protein
MTLHLGAPAPTGAPPVDAPPLVAPTPDASAIAPSLVVGWSTAATALRAAAASPTPMLVRLDPAGHAPIFVDFRHNAFSWDVPLELFPDEPSEVVVRTIAAQPDHGPLFDLPGRELDGLLWLVGLHGFAGGPASWIRPGTRVRLVRWPNFTVLPRQMAHIRMTAALVNAHLTTGELARATGVPISDAQRLVNALTLMDAVDVRVDEAAAPAFVPDAAAVAGSGERGIFRRLRMRLGI